MPLPITGNIPLSAGESSKSKPAYLIRFPEEIWHQLEDAQSARGGVTITHEGIISLNIPGQESHALQIQSSGTNVELHILSDTLSPLAVTNHRLAVPSSSLAALHSLSSKRERRVQDDQSGKKGKQRMTSGNESAPPAKNKVLQSLAAPMARTQSTPNSTTPTRPTIPLKTRVVQLLALGPSEVPEIVSRVGGLEADVMHVVRVVGKEVSPGIWTLAPQQYTKIKIGQWKYTYTERQQVVSLARAAFDQMGLPRDAEERVELERKEAEASQSSNASTSSEKAPYTPPEPVAVIPPAPLPKVAKPKVGGGLISKQKVKFSAQQRAASLPNVTKGDVASPRVGIKMKELEDETPSAIKEDRSREKQVKVKAEAPTVTEALKVKEEDLKVKEKGNKIKEKKAEGRPKEKELGRTADVKNPGKPEQVAKLSKKELEKLGNGDPIGKRKRASPETTSTIDEGRGRKRDIKPAPKSERRSIDYSSSESDSEPLAKTRKTSPTTVSIKRKPPPPALELNNTSHRDFITQPIPKYTKSTRPDPESLRERYEELFPAYQQLTRKMVKVHQAAEVGEGNVEEVEKMVERWGRWHKELEGIRRWFGER